MMLIVGEEKFEQPMSLGLVEWMVQAHVSEKATKAWVGKNMDSSGHQLEPRCEAVRIGQPPRDAAICLDVKDPFSLQSSDLVVVGVNVGKPALLFRIPIDVSKSDDETTHFLDLAVTVRDGGLTVHDRAPEGTHRAKAGEYPGVFLGCTSALHTESPPNDLSKSELVRWRAYADSKRRLIAQACANVGRWELRGTKFVRVVAR